MHILLFGGSFNPPHLGHAIVIEQAFELIPKLDELWILPTYNHAFGKDLAPATDRLEMCKLLISLDNCGKLPIQVCSLEIDEQSEGSTYQTLQSLKKRYPEHTFSFLMGSDQLPDFDKWNDYQQLLEEMHFYVYPRGSHRHDVIFPNMELLTSPTQVITNISSTLIRSRLKANLSIRRLILSSIFNYLTAHKLYTPGV
jgi:nicotinate-nucleotide adenylyltransferase